MNVWYIVDLHTNRRWARNRWATPKTVPDLYMSASKAFMQIVEGKISVMTKYDKTLRPTIQSAILTFEEII